MNDHGYMGHGLFVYEEAVRIPLIMRMTGKIKKNLVYEAPVEVGDIMPTAFSFLGLSFDKGKIHGKDLSPRLLDNAPPDHNRLVFMQRRHYETKRFKGYSVKGAKFSVRQGQWKYIVSEYDGDEELFNLKEDPGELTNLATREVEKKKELSSRLDAVVSSLKRISKVSDQNISDEDNERLRALGYVK